MKRIYKCIFEMLLGITIVALCIFVFHFSLLGMESYIYHYPQWLLGHCLAVLFVLCIFLLLFISFNYAISHNLRLSIKKATKFFFLITLIIFAYIAIIGIDYDLLFHKTKKYPAYPPYVKVKAYGDHGGRSTFLRIHPINLVGRGLLIDSWEQYCESSV